MLSFKLFGIPVGVHVTFLFVALLGATTYRGWDIAIWTLAAFISILAHEMGHALVARGFGADGVNVTLYGLGGVTTFSYSRVMEPWRSFIVSASGSAVGIALGGAVWFAARSGVFDGSGSEMTVFINSLFFTSLVWGILNWIPVVPLDGGHMVQHFIAIFSKKKAPLLSQIITWIAVTVIVPYAWLNDYQFGAIIVLMFAFAGLREYRQKAAIARPGPVRHPQPQSQPAPPADPTPPKPPPDFPI
jgi:stage IV sporulation protein FB